MGPRRAAAAPGPLILSESCALTRESEGGGSLDEDRRALLQGLPIRDTMLNRNKLLPLVALALSAAAGASIERLNLRQMIGKADAGIVGEITAHEVIAVPLDRDGEEMTFTRLMVKGHDLVSGKPVSVQFSYPGGVLPGRRGGYNSEAPSQDDVKVGNRVVAFYKWSDNMGGGYASNALYASHGGLFRTFKDKKDRVIVQGRGTGFAVSKNIRLQDLRSAARKHDAAIRRERNEKAGGERR